MNIKEIMLKNENNLSIYASYDKDAIRLKDYINDIRPNYFRDTDRIIYSLSYSRYSNKTQVFSYLTNDHISRRMIHVQFVSKIARTIGRALNLNEDLIEAMALGHDIGHVPFGHTGEKILNDISVMEGEGYFNHNVQSVRTLMFLEDHGKGINLCIQTLDGILCHNGEFVQNEYRPVKKSVNDFLKQYNDCYTDKDAVKKLIPMTLEGCVVRISDIIAYIGRDIEDAIRLGIFKREDVPINIQKILGTSNREMVNSIVNDVINNSIDKPYIKMSDSVYNSLVQMKKFNYEHIYNKANTVNEINHFKEMFRFLFDKYVMQITNNDIEEDVFKEFLNDMDDNYLKNTSIKRKAIDYIAGMTDDYFTTQYEKYN